MNWDVAAQILHPNGTLSENKVVFDLCEEKRYKNVCLKMFHERKPSYAQDRC